VPVDQLSWPSTAKPCGADCATTLSGANRFIPSIRPIGWNGEVCYLGSGWREPAASESGNKERPVRMAKSLPVVFSADDRIDHHVYGTGTIVTVSDRITTIDFDAVGIKRFITDIVKLTRSDTAAPPKPVRRKKTVPRPAGG